MTSESFLDAVSPGFVSKHFLGNVLQACDFLVFFLISGLFLNLPLPKNVLESREVATKDGKK